MEADTSTYVISNVQASASKSSIRRFVITEKAPTRASSWLKAATTAFTFKTLLRKIKVLGSVIVKTDCETDGSSAALIWTISLTDPINGKTNSEYLQQFD